MRHFRYLQKGTHIYAGTIFLSAFLLFQVQPILGKYILPWFGSTPAVWTTTLLFFQVVLMLGYGYAHLIACRLRKTSQVMLHVALLVVASLLLPIIPGESWKVLTDEPPALGVLAVLGVAVGAQYFMVASTSPLLQSWFARSYPDGAPYRLYAISNTGSMLALLSYPFLVERFTTLQNQIFVWSGLFVVFGVLSAICGIVFVRSRDRRNEEPQENSAAIPTPRPSIPRILSWIGLSALGSIVLLSTVNRITTDLPAVPFLFILPLSLYLLTFIITFDSPRWYYRPLFSVLLPIFAVLALLSQNLFAPVLRLVVETPGVQGAVFIDLVARTVMLCVALFLACMSCHGELARSKPEPDHLTLFYLIMALGGAVGGIFVAIVAPVIFNDIWEYPIGLIGSVLLVLIVVSTDLINRVGPDSEVVYVQGFAFHPKQLIWLGRSIGGVAILLALIVSPIVFSKSQFFSEETIKLSRNFYGTLRISEAPTGERREYHGRIVHGLQSPSLPERLQPTMYYVRSSGVGIAIERHPARKVSGRQFRIGGVGMGIGTIAAYGENQRDLVRFYEINPDVIHTALNQFSYLNDAKDRGVELAIVEGDARISLEREALKGESQDFDVLVVDAFTGDAIPIHLLTEECFQIYQQHLADGGILAFHVSNLYLDLGRVVSGLAENSGTTAIAVTASGRKRHESKSVWILVTDNVEFLGDPEVKTRAMSVEGSPILWTDSFSSLFDVVKK